MAAPLSHSFCQCRINPTNSNRQNPANTVDSDIEGILKKSTMNKSELIENGCYFFVSYSDETMQYPLIETLVYVGVNVLSGDDDEIPMWYFQDPDSFSERGKFYLTPHLVK